MKSGFSHHPPRQRMAGIDDRRVVAIAVAVIVICNGCARGSAGARSPSPVIDPTGHIILLHQDPKLVPGCLVRRNGMEWVKHESDCYKIEFESAEMQQVPLSVESHPTGNTPAGLYLRGPRFEARYGNHLRFIFEMPQRSVTVLRARSFSSLDSARNDASTRLGNADDVALVRTVRLTRERGANAVLEHVRAYSASLGIDSVKAGFSRGDSVVIRIQPGAEGEASTLRPVTIEVLRLSDAAQRQYSIEQGLGFHLFQERADIGTVDGGYSLQLGTWTRAYASVSAVDFLPVVPDVYLEYGTSKLHFDNVYGAGEEVAVPHLATGIAIRSVLGLSRIFGVRVGGAAGARVFPLRQAMRLPGPHAGTMKTQPSIDVTISSSLYYKPSSRLGVELGVAGRAARWTIETGSETLTGWSRSGAPYLQASMFRSAR